MRSVRIEKPSLGNGPLVFKSHRVPESKVPRPRALEKRDQAPTPTPSSPSLVMSGLRQSCRICVGACDESELQGVCIGSAWLRACGRG